MKTKIWKALLPAAMWAITAGCSGTHSRQQDAVPLAAPNCRMCVGDKPRGVYYWKTVFSLNAAERDFLRQHRINRLYVRLFDVDEGEEYGGRPAPVPIATVRFQSAVPQDLEVVPVVFLTNDALLMRDSIAQSLYTRIRSMARANHLGPVREIQLDCDWTHTTRPMFFSLCRQLCQLAHPDSIAISSTIRLHQLAAEAPPVDRGVLMLYNTGNMRSPDTANSILHHQDVSPYLKHDIHYPLPLSLAFPTYQWGLVFSDDRFQRIVRHVDISDTTLFHRIDSTRYASACEQKVEGGWLEDYHIIRWETSQMKEIEAVKDMALQAIKSPVDGTLVYHLDSANLSKYNYKEIERILE